MKEVPARDSFEFIQKVRGKRQCHHAAGLCRSQEQALIFDSVAGEHDGIGDSQAGVQEEFRQRAGLRIDRQRALFRANLLIGQLIGRLEDGGLFRRRKGFHRAVSADGSP